MQNYVCENLKVCIRILYADQAKTFVYMYVMIESSTLFFFAPVVSFPG